MPQSMTDAVKRTAKKISDAYKQGGQESESIGQGLAEKQKTIDAVTAPQSFDKPATAASAGEKLNDAARYGDRPGEKRIDVKDMVKPLASYKKGTKSVPKTGTYKLHEGEKVVAEKNNPDSHLKDNKMATPFDMVNAGAKKAPKTIQRHEYHRTHNGKHVVTHKHHSADHKDEQHMFEKFSDAASHMEQNPPQPEQEMPQAAPAAGAPAAGAMPAAM